MTDYGVVYDTDGILLYCRNYSDSWYRGFDQEWVDCNEDVLMNMPTKMDNYEEVKEIGFEAKTEADARAKMLIYPN